MSNWISVESEPVPNRLVLVWYKGDYEFGITIRGKVNIYKKSGWSVVSDLPTHWQPLPDAPGDEE